MVGFSHVTGDLIVTLDADLQNPPEEIPRLVTKADEGYDVVGTVRQNRQDGRLRKMASHTHAQYCRQHDPPWPALPLSALLVFLRLVFGPQWSGQGVFTLFAVLFMFIGAQFVGMGGLGEYIGRIYNDVRARPRFFIQRVIRQEHPASKEETYP